MPLHDIGEHHVWLERELPSVAAQRVACAFLAKIGDVPWRAPSVPIAELSNQPVYEVRTAALEVHRERDVEIWYLHDYATGNIDLVAVTNS